MKFLDVSLCIFWYLSKPVQKIQKDTKRYMYLLEKNQKIQKDTKRYMYLFVSFCIFWFFSKRYMYLFVSFCIFWTGFERYQKIHKDTSKNFIVNKNANTHNYSFETFMVLSRLNLCRIRFRFRRINAWFEKYSQQQIIRGVIKSCCISTQLFIVWVSELSNVSQKKSGAIGPLLFSWTVLCFTFSLWKVLQVSKFQKSRIPKT